MVPAEKLRGEPEDPPPGLTREVDLERSQNILELSEVRVEGHSRVGSLRDQASAIPPTTATHLLGRSLQVPPLSFQGCITHFARSERAHDGCF